MTGRPFNLVRENARSKKTYKVEGKRGCCCCRPHGVYLNMCPTVVGKDKGCESAKVARVLGTTYPTTYLKMSNAALSLTVLSRQSLRAAQVNESSWLLRSLRRSRSSAQGRWQSSHISVERLPFELPPKFGVSAGFIIFGGGNFHHFRLEKTSLLSVLI